MDNRKQAGNSSLNAWVPPPKRLKGFPDAERVKPKTYLDRKKKMMRKRWRDPNGRIYEWDYRHGNVEVYDSRGKHIGEFDPVTARKKKGANPTYKVEP